MSCSVPVYRISIVNVADSLKLLVLLVYRGGCLFLFPVLHVLKSVSFCISSLRPSDERHPTVTADGTVDNLAQAVDMILNQRR